MTSRNGHGPCLQPEAFFACPDAGRRYNRRIVAGATTRVRLQSVARASAKPRGEVSEWLIELVSKTSVPFTVPRVRIPPSPFGPCRDSCRGRNHGILDEAAVITTPLTDTAGRRRPSSSSGLDAFIGHPERLSQTRSEPPQYTPRKQRFHDSSASRLPTNIAAP